MAFYNCGRLFFIIQCVSLFRVVFLVAQLGACNFAVVKQSKTTLKKIIMKNLIITFISVLMLFFSSSTVQGAEDKVIVIKPGSLTETTTPNRGPELVPISAYYDGFTSSVYVTFSMSIGDVDVSIINIDTGESIEETINAYSSIAIIPISGNPGLYCISFMLQSGVEYIGEFEL